MCPRTMGVHRELRLKRTSWGFAIIGIPLGEQPREYNMGKRNILSETEIHQALADLPGWRIKREKLHREYQFADFVHAFGFMAAAAVTVEAMNHHPDWSNVWNRVTVDLTTHDAGGVTGMDVELATKLEALAQKLT